MPKEKRIINVGGTYIEGNVNIKNGDFVGGNQNKVETAVENWFLPIYQAIENHPATSKQEQKDIQDNVKQIGDEIQKGADADITFLQKRLKNLKKMAPDIWEVVLATISNPITGLSLTVTKVASKLAAIANETK